MFVGVFFFIVFWFNSYSISTMCCLGAMSEEPGPRTDVEDIYLQERAKETEDGEAAGKESMEEDDAGEEDDRRRVLEEARLRELKEEEEANALRQRLKNYIEKNKTSNTNCDSFNNDPRKTVDANPTYDAIKSLRIKGLEAPNLNGGTATSFSNDLGNFKPAGEVWGAPLVERQVFGSRQNISLNFDPSSMICKSCGNEHRVLSGGGEGFSSGRKIFILSDQAFPADTKTEGGGDCVAIIRLEYGSLNELIELFCDITRGCQIPAGSVLLLASLSHLVDVGLEAYTEDFNNAVLKAGRLFNGGVIVLPGTLFPPAVITNGMVVRYMADLLSWSSSVARVSDAGGPILYRCYIDLRDLLIEKGAGNAQTNYSVRYRLPEKLGGHVRKKWESSGYTGLKTGMDPLDPTLVVKILNVALSELSVGLGFGQIKLANLNGGHAIGSFSRNVVIIGASHGKRLVQPFTDAGASVTLIETPGWRPTPVEVSDLAKKILEATSVLTDALLVLCPLDNSYFQTMGPDGSITSHRRGEDGRYHVIGDLLCGPAEAAKKMFQQLTPLLKSFADLDKILLVPLPRYLWQPCCDDPGHCTNVTEEGYSEAQLSDLDACHRLWRGLAHRDRIQNLKVCNTGHLLTSRLLWCKDPVHPIPIGYTSVTRYLINGVSDMEGKRKAILEDHVEARGSKQPRLEDSSVFTPPPLFRPSWTTNTGQFVTPRPPRPYSRGRGRVFGRGYPRY
jgi:hypothetical protein